MKKIPALKKLYLTSQDVDSFISRLYAVKREFSDLGTLILEFNEDKNGLFIEIHAKRSKVSK